jgi:hypothetical protein
MKLSKFWVVRDPTPNSELEDILFETETNRFASYVIGTGLDQFKHENHTLYTEAGEAKRDAQARLKKQGMTGGREGAKKDKTALRVAGRFVRQPK